MTEKGRGPIRSRTSVPTCGGVCVALTWSPARRCSAQERTAAAACAKSMPVSTALRRNRRYPGGGFSSASRGAVTGWSSSGRRA